MKKLFISVIIFVGVLLSNCKVLADGNDFSITPIFPQNQKAEVQSYFDLTVIPNSSQTLKIKVKNNSSINQKYKISINTANTNQNGIIDYSMSTFEKDSSMTVALKDCLTSNTSQIEVPSNTEKIVEFDLKIPNTYFKGIVLGGITLEPVIESIQEGITNVFTRTIAVQLSELAETVEPSLSAGDVKVSQENYRNNVKLSLRNPSSIIISKVTAQISIFKKGQKEAILTQTKEQLSFAPNSNFYLMTEWDNQFDSGDYKYIINLKDIQGHQWAFRKNFKIKNNTAIILNKTSVDRKKRDWMVFIYYFVIIALFITIFLVFRFLNLKIKFF